MKLSTRSVCGFSSSLQDCPGVDERAVRTAPTTSMATLACVPDKDFLLVRAEVVVTSLPLGLLIKMNRRNRRFPH